MSQFTNFEGLPLIVHDLILRSLPSPKDVANTIRASPVCLHAFVTGRRGILLSAMRNFLSLENQHLMNLVMAAAHYFEQGKSGGKTSTSSCLDFNDIVDFDEALDEFSCDHYRNLRPVTLDEFSYDHSGNLRPLTLNTFDRAISLYAITAKTIAGYSLFTVARSQSRIPLLSTPEAGRSRHKYLYRDDRTPDDEEMSRLWRGFLLYELICLMHGTPHIAAAAMGKRCRKPKQVRSAREFFEDVPRYMQEEVMCVKHYIREQYDLAFNSLVESFELAVGKLGRRALDTAQPGADSTVPIIELEDGLLESSVQYLFEPPYDHSNTWTINVAMLGVSFFQRFVSWDSSTRLDFIRITYPFLGSQENCRVSDFRKHYFNFDSLMEEKLGWSQDYMDDLDIYEDLESPSESRLRAVGWIFWKNPERLYFMNLSEDQLDFCYGSCGKIEPHVRLKGRPHLMETLVQPNDWEHVCRHFGPSFSKDERREIRGLFSSTERLESGDIARVVRILRQQDDEVAPTEAREEDG